MIDSNPSNPSFLERIIANDSAKKGAAAMIAGVLVALVQETLWPAR